LRRLQAPVEGLDCENESKEADPIAWGAAAQRERFDVYSSAGVALAGSCSWQNEVQPGSILCGFEHRTLKQGRPVVLGST